ncbi:MAG: hypothetical protein ACRCZS_16255 [Chroococcidiopsis sp.]
MANIDVELYMETGAGDTLNRRVGTTTDLYLPIWQIALGQNIESLQGANAGSCASTIANMLNNFRQFPQSFETLTPQQQSILGGAEAYLIKWHNLCLIHPACTVRLIGGSLNFPVTTF